MSEGPNLPFPVLELSALAADGLLVIGPVVTVVCAAYLSGQPLRNLSAKQVVPVAFRGALCIATIAWLTVCFGCIYESLQEGRSLLTDDSLYRLFPECFIALAGIIGVSLAAHAIIFVPLYLDRALHLMSPPGEE